MKGIVVYDSSFGNTRKIAEALAEALKESGVDTTLVHVKKAFRLSAKDYGFLVVGSPTRFGTMSFATRFFLNGLNGREWAGKPFAAFDTQNHENIEQKQSCASEKIAARLIEKQLIQALPVLKAVVFGGKGPLKDGEVQRAKDYARELALKLKGGV